MKIGNARISIDEQSLALQRDALKAAHRAEEFEDSGVSGIATRRPVLEAAFARIGAVGVLVIWTLDQLVRALPDLIQKRGKRLGRPRKTLEQVAHARAVIDADCKTAAGHGWVA